MTTAAHPSAPAAGPASGEDRAPGAAGGLTKYVFIQDDPFYLPRVLDKYLREFSETTAGVNIQPTTQGNRTVVQTALDLLKMYGPWYFQWKLRRFIGARLKAKIVNGWLGSTARCHSVHAVARKYGVPVHEASDVNSDEFLAMLDELGVQFIVSISGTQFYRKALREQISRGIVNCHGALLPKYRGLMPSFWTLANGEREGGVTVHFVDAKLDSGPIIVQKRYRIHPRDTLEDIMARSKDLAAEAIIECVRIVEGAAARGEPPPTIDNDATQATHFSMPTRADVERFRAQGHRFF